MEEFDALPEGSSSTEVLRALFEGTEDTVYTSTSLDGETEDAVLPEGFENVVIEGYGNTDIIANTHDNIITGNIGNNVIDGGKGNDTFITQGNFDQSTGILNQDGSVTLTSVGGGTDTLITLENVQFDDGIRSINDMIDSASLRYELSINNTVNIELTQNKNDFVVEPKLYDFGRDGQVALSNNGNFVVQGMNDKIEVTNLNSGNIETINLLSANPYGNFEPVGVSDDGETVFIKTWNGFSGFRFGWNFFY